MGLAGVGMLRQDGPMEEVAEWNNPLQENEAPQVTILYPKAGESPKTHTRIPYKIEVTDTEDGASRYDEINSNEVMVEVRYLSHILLEKERKSETSVSDSGLQAIAGSNCLLCHDFRGKRIGPSFYEIGQRYQSAGKDVQQTLVQRIIEGSSGVWGEQVMPSHPELSSGEVENMLQWIHKFATQENVNYYHGLEGSLELIPTSPALPDGVFVITSAYRDHGVDGQNKKSGQDQQVVSPAP